MPELMKASLANAEHRPTWMQELGDREVNLDSRLRAATAIGIEKPVVDLQH